MNNDRRQLLEACKRRCARGRISREHQARTRDRAQPPHRHDCRRRAHRDPDAGKSLVRSLLRHDARGARLWRSARRCAALRRPVWIQPTRRKRSRATVPSRRAESGPAVPGGPAARLARHARGVESRQVRPLGADKGSNTMAYLTRDDIPFHYALADAFTVCDAYHCSFLGATDPNRYHMWTGWVGNDGQNGGPVLDNAEAGYDWYTYPERLEAAGVSWKIYQDAGHGLDAEHYWGWGPTRTSATTATTRCCTSISIRTRAGQPARTQGAQAAPTSRRAARCSTILAHDVASGHAAAGVVDRGARGVHRAPATGPSNYGAWYVSQMLEALTSRIPRCGARPLSSACTTRTTDSSITWCRRLRRESRAQGLSTIGTDQRDLRRQRQATRPVRTVSACACR